ncbi:acyl-CoA dehydrogenase family protein [Maribacter sp. 2210JD10-5]|uniref:acyl-CoA dehydrogenase family protein n=1 Tax=Maribacter sp. 2210JD10-5 TaxID=3386272 RepID=UPI0039BC9996
MDFSWKEEHENYKKEVIEFAQSRLGNTFTEADKNCTFSKDDWQKCADFGLLDLAIPKEYNRTNKEIDILGATLAMEGLGYGYTDNGLPFALSAQMWTVQLPIAQFGSIDQKKEYLPALSSGKCIASHALTEPNAGSDVFSMQLKAEKVDGGYLLNGEKCLITLAPVADVLLVFATTNPKLGKWGITAFLVKRNTKGLKISENKEKMGLRTVPIGDLFFKDCFIPEACRLGKEGGGWAITNHSLEHDRCSILASQLGAMERQLETAINFVKNRKQFDKKISEFQSVSNRIANMKLRLETSRLLLYKVAWLKNQGKSAMLEAALLKLQLSEDFVSSSMDTIRLHGGAGYLSQNEIERDLRDAIGGIIYAGTSDIQRNIIAKLLGL